MPFMSTRARVVLRFRANVSRFRTILPARSASPRIVSTPRFVSGSTGARRQSFRTCPNGRQGIVQLVGHAGNRLTQGRHLFRLHQLVACVEPLRIELPPLADVAYEGIEARRTVFVCGMQRGRDFDPHRAVVRPPEADQVVADRAVATQPRDEVGASPFIDEPVRCERPHPAVRFVRVQPEHELQVRVGAQRLDGRGVESAYVDSFGDGFVQTGEQFRLWPGGTARTHAEARRASDARVRLTRTASVPGQARCQLPRGAAGVGVA